MSVLDSKLVGIIPAAGRGTRISPIPMSKELYPIGFNSPEKGGRPKVASEYLLERMARAGVREAFVVLRSGKWDIPAYFEDGAAVDISLAYLLTRVPFGVPFTVDQAYPFVRDATVLLGFPDILFWPEDASKRVLSRLNRGDADVVLGLFPALDPRQVGVVDFDSQNLVYGVYEKSDFTHLSYMWAIAAWTPRFTEFLHVFVESRLRVLSGSDALGVAHNLPARTEYPMGDVIHDAIQQGVRVEAEIFPEGHCIDIGTPENLREAILAQT